jgi:hypothetical protein
MHLLSSLCTSSSLAGLAGRSLNHDFSCCLSALKRDGDTRIEALKAIQALAE